MGEPADKDAGSADQKVTPDYISNRVGYYDPWAHTAHSCLSKVDERVIAEVEEHLSNLAINLSHIVIPVDLCNGPYLMNTRGDIFTTIHEEKSCTISLKYVDELMDCVRHHGGLASDTGVHDLYSKAGGSLRYVSIPRGSFDIKYFDTIVDEGYMYVVGYTYKQ